MSPVATAESAPAADLSSIKTVAQAAASQTNILYRTPWRPPVTRSAHGMYMELEDGRTIIDAVGGAAVTCIGNGHPKVVQAIKDQADKLSYVYQVQLTNRPAEDLAKILVDSGKGAFSQCGFVSGGSEAMEAAIKLARQYYYETGQKQRTNFIARKLSYHGNTLGTLGLAYHPARRAPYEVNLSKDCFHHVSPAYAKRFQKSEESEEQYVERLRQELEDKFQELGPDTVIGFVAETVVGATSGVVPPPKGYLKAMKSVCEKHGALFILDEVMSGMGRMGTLHGWELYSDGATPDIQAVAKGLGGGYASIGAVLMSERISTGIRDNSNFWNHGHTYQAHPIACAASLAVQNVIIDEDLIAKAWTQGEKFGAYLRNRLLAPNTPALPFVFDVRGNGCFWGVEFDFSGSEAAAYDFKGKRFGPLLQAQCFENCLIILGMSGGANLEGTEGEHAIFAPPYNITDAEIEKVVDLFVKSVDEVLSDARR
ncbi:PLP-dependent transferase [Phellopilus nigrolimitatus]|nr:PLP-dependent transferase [Phellopilus nigrolimitatus]